MDLVRIGFYGDTHADEVLALPSSIANKAALHELAARISQRGDQTRDWVFDGFDLTFHPYDDSRTLLSADEIPAGAHRYFWPWRVTLWGRSTFGGGTYRSRGRGWWEWHQLPRDKEASRLSIAFVTTHNHFVLDRGGKVFNRSAPVIKRRHRILHLIGLGGMVRRRYHPHRLRSDRHLEVGGQSCG